MKTKITVYPLLTLIFLCAGNASAYTEGWDNNYFGTNAGGSIILFSGVEQEMLIPEITTLSSGFRLVRTTTLVIREPL